LGLDRMHAKYRKSFGTGSREEICKEWKEASGIEKFATEFFMRAVRAENGCVPRVELK